MDTLFESGDGNPPTRESKPGRGVAGDDRPLAARVRPATLADFVGQSHLLGADSALRTAIEQGHPHSMILYGPPGTGKTTLARMVAEHANAAFEELSAVQAGRAEVRAVLERAAHRRRMSGPPTPGAAGVQGVGGTHTVFFLDEIHRFNKAQQDALLPAVEDGLVTLIGATTENPAFEVNGALLSRTRVYALQALSDEEVGTVLRRALTETTTPVDDDALDFLAARSEGDARTALNALELALATAAELGETHVTVPRAEDALQQRAVLYDKGGDRHYDYISAWIKATRGSDPDASLYYLAVMLEGGEDPRFIVRRMVILASEDIGNADPPALVGRGRRGPGGRARRPAGGHVRARAGGYLSLARAEVERRRQGAGRGAQARARTRRRAGSRMAAVGAPAGAGRRRLRQPPRPPRTPRRTGASAGRACRRALLRARRGRGRARAAPGAGSPAARALRPLLAFGGGDPSVLYLSECLTKVRQQ